MKDLINILTDVNTMSENNELIKTGLKLGQSLGEKLDQIIDSIFDEIENSNKSNN